MQIKQKSPLSKRRSFSLIEVLLVILLLSSVVSFVAFKAPAWLEESKIERGVEKIRSRLLVAQELMLSYHVDLTVTLCQEKGELTLTFDAPWIDKKPFLKNSTSPLKIPGIEAIALNGKETHQIILTFRTSEASKTQDKLTVAGKKTKVVLALPSFPTPIYKEGQKIDYEKNWPEATYPKEAFSIS